MNFFTSFRFHKRGRGIMRNKDCLEPTVANETAGIHVLFYF